MYLVVSWYGERLDRGIHTRIKHQFDDVDWTNPNDWASNLGILSRQRNPTRTSVPRTYKTVQITGVTHITNSLQCCYLLSHTIGHN